MARCIVALLNDSDRTVVDKRGRARRVKFSTRHGVRTLLGGLALCQCGNTVQGAINATGKHVYRCNPDARAAPRPRTASRCPPAWTPR